MPIPHPLFGPAMARLGDRLGAGSLYGDAVRLLRYGRGVDNRRLRSELGYEPRFDAVARSATSPPPSRGLRLVADAGASAPSSTGSRGAAMSGPRRPPDRIDPPSCGVPTSCAASARGVDDGLDPMRAAEAAAADLPKLAARRRSSGWRGGCAASTTRTSGASTRSSPRPPTRSSSSSTTAGGGSRPTGVEQRPRARPGDARLQPRRRRCSRSTRR